MNLQASNTRKNDRDNIFIQKPVLLVLCKLTTQYLGYDSNNYKFKTKTSYLARLFYAPKVASCDGR